jgi:hypothetical protein
MSTTTSRPADPGGANPGTRFLDRPLRNITMAAASLLVVAAIGLFLAGLPGSPGVSFTLTSYAISTRNVVVYGKVTTSSDHPVRAAEVQIYRVVKGRVRTLRELRTNREGIYRVVLGHLSSGTLDDKVSFWLGGQHHRGVVRFPVRRGRAYGVSAHLATRGSLFFLPINSY